jgi:predicted amidohydrolase
LRHSRQRGAPAKLPRHQRPFPIIHATTIWIFAQVSPVKVALGQTIGTPADVAANLAVMKRLAVEATGQGSDLLLLPELFLSGYNIGVAARTLAEPRDGASAMAVASIAASTGIAIAYGYPERGAEGVYNSALVVDRAGKTVANYRKAHLWGEYERAQFVPGRSSDSFVLDGVRFGILICYDIEFPEPARDLSLSGADAIMALSATSAPYPVIPRHLVPTRAYENRVFVLFCNHAGEELGLRYAGESCVAAPDGEILASCRQAEGLAFATIDLSRYAAYRREHNYADDRRPELYRR